MGLSPTAGGQFIGLKLFPKEIDDVAFGMELSGHKSELVAGCLVTSSLAQSVPSSLRDTCSRKQPTKF